MNAIVAHEKAGLGNQFFDKMRAGNDPQSISARTILHTQEFQEKFVEKFKDNPVMLEKFRATEFITEARFEELQNQINNETLRTPQ